MSRASRSSSSPLLLAILVAGGVGLLASASLGVPAGIGGAFAYLLPALLLLGVLLGRRYPGERALATALSRRRRLRKLTATIAIPTRAVRMPRGGRLIASSLAVRPPPELAVASVG